MQAQNDVPSLIRERVRGLEFIGEQGKGHCPLHEDKKKSFSINTAKRVWSCHKGCGSGSFDKLIKMLETVHAAPSSECREIKKKYRYLDEEGVLLYEVLRYEPKDFRARRPNGKGGWIWNLEGVRRIPYGLPELLEASPDERCYIVEGEKDVRALRKLGLLATCNSGGAGKWKDAFSEFFKGRPVAIIPDNDDPGRVHAQQVARMLSGHAKEVRVVELPGVPEKGDVSDWISLGRGASDLKQATKATPCWFGDSAASLEAYSGGSKIRPMRMKDLISLVKKLGEDKDEWIWENLIAAESVVMLVGAPKAGKSTFVAAMVAAIARGEPFLGLKTKKIKILILGLEERRRDVAKRFKQLGVTKGIRYLQGPLRASPEAYAALRDYVKSHGIRLIVIDTLPNFWQLNDENSAAETEKALAPIRQLARDLKVAVLLIHHSRKGEMIPGESIRGSSAIFGVVDASLSFKSGKGFDDTERTLQVQSRLSGHWQLRLDFRDGRYHVVGKNDLSAREQELFKLLKNELQTAEEIGAKVGLRGTTARRACENLAAKLPDKVRVEGTGRKGDPKRYGLSGSSAHVARRAA